VGVVLRGIVVLATIGRGVGLLNARGFGVVVSIINNIHIKAARHSPAEEESLQK
jgi:hypothetical protein